MAQRLEQLVQEQLRYPPSPGEDRGALQKDEGRRVARFLPPTEFSSVPLEVQGPPPTEKEALLRRLVALLEEEAETINQKVMG